MNEGLIKVLLKEKSLRIRQVDIAKIKSMIQLAEINARVIQLLQLNEDSATPIFKELYDSIRQLGDATWWLQGYEPKDHETSLESLKYLNIKNKNQLNNLDRFRKIRNDANYRGYKVPKTQAQEIISFWNEFSEEIIKEITNQIK